MNVIETPLPGVLVLEPRVFRDDRGYFLETYSRRRYAELGLPEFVQDNLSFSRQGVLRGLHYQHPAGQGKLVSVAQGEVLDIAVDIRLGSPTFGKWHGVLLSAENQRQYWVPVGYAHGFVVLSETAVFSYKCTDYYTPSDEGSVLWSDPDLGIDWKVNHPILAPKDASAPRLAEIPPHRLPSF